MPLHCLSLTQKQINHSILCWNVNRNTSVKLSKKTQEGAPADLEKNIVIFYFSHTQQKQETVFWDVPSGEKVSVSC